MQSLLYIVDARTIPFAQRKGDAVEIERVDKVDADYALRFKYCGTRGEADEGLWYYLLPHQEDNEDD